MPDFKVRISEKALHQIESIADYILPDSPQNADAVTAAIVTMLDSLNSSPERFRKVGISRKYKSNVHAVSTHSFMIYYRVDRTIHAVEIITIIRSSRRQPRRFP